MRPITRLLFAGLTLVLVEVRADAAGDLAIYNMVYSFPPELLARFEVETGIKVAADTFQTNEEMLANLRAGTGLYDVVVATDYLIEPMIDDGLLRPIDVRSMANFKNVKERFTAPWFDPERRFTAPLWWGTVGFAYDSAQVDGGVLEESWKEYFDPRPELAGKVVGLDDQLALYRAAAFYVGVDPCTENPREAQKILDVLLAQKPSVLFYDTDDNPDAVLALFDEKKVALGQGWNGDIFKFKNFFLDSIVYVYPKEGIEVFTDNLAVPANAPHPDNGKIFINWMMNPRNIAEVSNYTATDNAIAGSEAYMDRAIVQDPIVNAPAQYMERFREVKNCSQAARDLSDKVWARLWPRTIGPPR